MRDHLTAATTPGSPAALAPLVSGQRVIATMSPGCDVCRGQFDRGGRTPSRGDVAGEIVSVMPPGFRQARLRGHRFLVDLGDRLGGWFAEEELRPVPGNGERRPMSAPTEVLSFGGGPPSLALAVLNAWGEVEPRAEIAVFADTGWEKGETYRLLPVYEEWLAEHGLELVRIHPKEGSLRERLVRSQGSLWIPAHTSGGGMLRRQCTYNFKVRPINSYLRARFGRGRFQVQLALTWDEAWRLKDSREDTVVNRWPLIERRLTRAMTVEIVKLAGLPVPPWSACVGCPLQSSGQWRRIAAQWPEDYRDAVQVDERIREHLRSHGPHTAYLHYTGRPLREAVAAGQGAFPLGEDGALRQAQDGALRQVEEGDLGQCESGHCFT